MDWATYNHVPQRLADPPAPKLLRTLWVMTRHPNKSVTAGIYESRYGHELRVYYGQDENNVLVTALSRTDDTPLEHQAGELLAVLDSQGWVAAGGTAKT